MPIEDFTAIAGGRAELRCTVSSSDSKFTLQHLSDLVKLVNLCNELTEFNAISDPLNPSSIEWKRVGSDLLPNNAYSTNGILYIDNVQPDSAGEYECIAFDPSNRNTKITLRSRLRIICKYSIYVHF